MRTRGIVAIIICALLVFCARRDPLRREPLLDLKGASVSLDPIEHNGHKDLARELRDAMHTAMVLAPRHAVAEVDSGGALRIRIEILALNRRRYTETFEGICRRAVPDRPHLECNEDGQCTEVPAQEEVPCPQTEEVEDVSGRFVVQLVDSDGIRLRHQYHLSVTGTSFPLKLMASRVSEQIKRLFIPWFQNPRTDKVAFSQECRAGSSHCREAYRAFMNQELLLAESLLAAELGAYTDLAVPIPGDEYPGVAKALCNRGLVREYLEKYDLALVDYRRAAVVAPNPKCAALLERLKNYGQARRAFGAAQRLD